PARRCPLPRPARHRQEPRGAGDRLRRDPAGPPRALSRGARPRRGSRRSPARRHAEGLRRLRHDRAAAHHRRSRDAEASAHGGRGSPRDRDAALRARLDAAHVESARGGLGQAPRRHRGRHRDARPAPPPRARAHVWAPELAHPAPQRAERALTEQRWDDASRFGAGRPRSPSRGYLEIPSSAPKTPTQGACSITIERGRRLALGTALLHWPVLPRPQLAGFQVSTEADRKSTRLNSSHVAISYAVFCLKKKKQKRENLLLKDINIITLKAA